MLKFLQLTNYDFLNFSEYINNAAIEQIDQIGYFFFRVQFILIGII